MITEKQLASIDELAKKFDWNSEEVDAMKRTLEDANHHDLLEKAITANARNLDWSPTEENAVREAVLGKDAPGMRITSTVTNGLTVPNIGKGTGK